MANEKRLIDLAHDYFDSVPWYADIADLNPEELIDHLIANGVTIQKWIPVTERLPEMHTKVLCCGIRGGRFIAELSTWGNGNLYWDKRNGKGCPEVTHWMPLPEPPKEERRTDEAS